MLVKPFVAVTATIRLVLCPYAVSVAGVEVDQDHQVGC